MGALTQIHFEHHPERSDANGRRVIRFVRQSDTLWEPSTHLDPRSFLSIFMHAVMDSPTRAISNHNDRGCCTVHGESRESHANPTNRDSTHREHNLHRRQQQQQQQERAHRSLNHTPTTQQQQPTCPRARCFSPIRVALTRRAFSPGFSRRYGRRVFACMRTSFG